MRMSCRKSRDTWSHHDAWGAGSRPGPSFDDDPSIRVINLLTEQRAIDIVYYRLQRFDAEEEATSESLLLSWVQHAGSSVKG